MRIKLTAIAVAIFALAVGATTSQAALQNAVKANVKFAKAGGPGSIELQLVNMDTNGPLPEGKPLSANQLESMLLRKTALQGVKTPERISRIIVSTKAGKYNSKALPYCTLTDASGNKPGIPSRANPPFSGAESLAPIPGSRYNAKSTLKGCPLKSLVGKGKFTANVGMPGVPYDLSQSGGIAGDVYVYNYKPARGDALGTIAMLVASIPVPVNQYIYTGMSKAGRLTVKVPNRDELPSRLEEVVPPGVVSMTSMDVKLTAPKPPSTGKGKKKKPGKPLFTIKSFKNLDIYGQLVRE